MDEWCLHRKTVTKGGFLKPVICIRVLKTVVWRCVLGCVCSAVWENEGWTVLRISGVCVVVRTWRR